MSLLGGMFVVALFCFWEWKGAKLPIVPSKSSSYLCVKIFDFLFVSVYFPVFNCNWCICWHVHQVSAVIHPF